MANASSYPVLGRCLSFFLATGGLVGATGCGASDGAGDGSERTGEAREDIIGGTATFARPEVVNFQTPAVNTSPCPPAAGSMTNQSTNCTATLIAPRYLLTAAHCVSFNAMALGGSITATNTSGTAINGLPGAFATFSLGQVRGFNNCSSQTSRSIFADVAVIELLSP